MMTTMMIWRVGGATHNMLALSSRACIVFVFVCVFVFEDDEDDDVGGRATHYMSALSSRACRAIEDLKDHL